MGFCSLGFAACVRCSLSFSCFLHSSGLAACHSTPCLGLRVWHCPLLSGSGSIIFCFLPLLSLSPPNFVRLRFSLFVGFAASHFGILARLALHLWDLGFPVCYFGKVHFERFGGDFPLLS